jgi:hypothetical protein
MEGTGKRGEEGQNSSDRATGTGQPWQASHTRTVVTGHLGQDSIYMSVSGQVGLIVHLDMTETIRRLGHDSKDRAG